MKRQCLALFSSLLLCQAAVAADDCKFDLDKEKTELKWTGYKTPKKVGVSGTFKKIDLSGHQPAASPLESIKNLSFTIDVSSLNSGDPARDVKISKILLFGTDKITGTLKSQSESELVFDTTVNGVTKPISLKTTTKGSKISANGYMDVLDFTLSKNLANFAAACKEKHEDKTWSDVNIDLKLKFKKVCK